MVINLWAQWDAQTNDRAIAWIELNNEYLAIERGTFKINSFHYSRLHSLLSQAYQYPDPFIEWWLREFDKLPGYSI